MACKNALCWKTRIFSSFEKAKFWSVLIWNLSLFHFKFYLKIMLNYKTFDICCRYLGKIPKILNISQDSEVYANFIFHRITPLDILHVIQWVNHFAKNTYDLIRIKPMWKIIAISIIFIPMSSASLVNNFNLEKPKN